METMRIDIPFSEKKKIPTLYTTPTEKAFGLSFSPVEREFNKVSHKKSRKRMLRDGVRNHVHKASGNQGKQVWRAGVKHGGAEIPIPSIMWNLFCMRK
jgi:hypothetical protein